MLMPFICTFSEDNKNEIRRDGQKRVDHGDSYPPNGAAAYLIQPLGQGEFYNCK
jgi:hypothetical protein